jgi:peptidoglycan hydrolase-like protein with peptidoglycan-binding domain
MSLSSARFAGVAELEACAVDDAAHLTIGASGAHVALVQQALIDLGESVGADGADGGYGPSTAAAVSSYKTQRGIANSAGQIDAIVGKLTIASLDGEIDEFDTQVIPCLSDRAAGPSIDLAGVPEPAFNALLGVLGLGSLIEVDAEGATNVLLGLADTPGTADALAGVAAAAVGLFGEDPEPARGSLVQSLPGVAGAISLVEFPSVKSDIGTGVQDLVNLVTGMQLIAQLIAQAGPPGTPARDLTKAQALAIAATAHQQGIITMNPAPVIDPSGTITSPAATAAIDIGSTIGGVVFKSVQFADKRFPANHPQFPYNPVVSVLQALDVRHLVGMVRLATHLNQAFGITEIHHSGISGSHDPRGDCHRQGRACDFVGARGTFSDVPFHLTVLNNWAIKTVPNVANPAKPRLPDWPTGTRALEYRLASDPSADGFARNFFLDLYGFVAGEFQDRISGPGQTGAASTIGTPTHIMNPDHPTSSPKTTNGREAHRGHLHFQIGPTGTQGP